MTADMVISFYDSMQLTFAARRPLIAARKVYPFKERRDGSGRPACSPTPAAFVHRAAVSPIPTYPQVRRGRVAAPSSRWSRCCRWCVSGAFSATRKFRGEIQAPTRRQMLRNSAWIAVAW